MQCPYCREEIATQAIRCKHCKADLAAFGKLLSEVRSLREEQKSLSEKVDLLRTKLVGPGEIGQQGSPSNPGDEAKKNSDSRPRIVCWLIAFLVPAALLGIVAHPILIMLLDVNYKWLLALLILLPAPFAFSYSSMTPMDSWSTISSSALCALAASLLMSTWIALYEGTNILPAGPGEWRQLTFTFLSISMSSFTGAALGSRAYRRASGQKETPGQVAKLIKELLWNDGGSEEGNHRLTLQEVQKAIEVAKPVLGFVFSLLSGIGSIPP